MKKKNIFLIRILFVGSILLGASSFDLFAQDVSTILDKASGVYQNSKGASIHFKALTLSSDKNEAREIEGTIDMKGEQFVLITPDTHTFFNGTTQWVYFEGADEVNISNPTLEEMQTINPILLLQNYSKGYKVTLKGTAKDKANKAVDVVLLTPRQKDAVKNIELYLDKQTAYPSQMTLTMQDGVMTMIEITKLKLNTNYPDSYFVFKTTDYPEVEIIDLR